MTPASRDILRRAKARLDRFNLVVHEPCHEPEARHAVEATRSPL